MLKLVSRRPSRTGSGRMIAVFIATVIFAGLAVAALTIMAVWTPVQNHNAIVTANYSHGVNLHTKYDRALRRTVRLNGRIQRVAKRQERLMVGNVRSSGRSAHHARVITGRLRDMVQLAIPLQERNAAIAERLHTITGINAAIRSNIAGVLTTSRKVHQENAVSNADNAEILRLSRVIAAHQSATAGLQRAVKVQAQRIQCSPFVHHCGGRASSSVRPRRQLRAVPEAPQPSPAGDTPSAGHGDSGPVSRLPRPVSPAPAPVLRRLLPGPSAPSPSPSASARRSQHRLPRLDRPWLLAGSPLAAAVESGAATVGLAGGGIAWVGVSRRRGRNRRGRSQLRRPPRGGGLRRRRRGASPR